MNGESRASQRISSTQERPIPAMSLWWRSSGCRWRGWSIAAANSSSGRRGPGFRARASRPSRPRRPRRPAAASPRPAAWSRTRAAAARARPRAGPAPARRGLWARRVCRRPAAARPTSGGSAAPGRRTRPPASSRPAAPPVSSRPTSASSGGSKVFITFIPGASDRLDHRRRDSAASRRRATISTSGSSGMPQIMPGSRRRSRRPSLPRSAVRRWCCGRGRPSAVRSSR